MSRFLEYLTPIEPKATAPHPGGPTPYQLITAAGEERERERQAREQGFVNIADACRAESERLLVLADSMRGL